MGPGGALGKLPTHKSELLAKLARTTPYYKRNRAHICSFWVKGECKRGEECPYRHEKPSDPDDPLSTQNMKDRYYGTNDPVADKILKRAQAMPSLEPPEDRMITTLYLGGLDESTQENDIRNAFYSYGEMRSVTIVPKQGESVRVSCVCHHLLCRLRICPVHHPGSCREGGGGNFQQARHLWQQSHHQVRQSMSPLCSGQ